MSQYIANLNTDTPPTDDLFSAHDDLSLFANTDFFDFDMGDQLNHLPGDFEASISNKKSSTVGWQAGSGTASGQDFLDGKFCLALHCFHHRTCRSCFSTIVVSYFPRRRQRSSACEVQPDTPSTTDMAPHMHPSTANLVCMFHLCPALTLLPMIQTFLHVSVHFIGSSCDLQTPCACILSNVGSFVV
jgi:hypothetical protein